MLKLKRYLKPYIGILLVGVLLLFGQAMLELTLPNYMSDIVNIGLQQGGITEAAPEVIDSGAMQLMQQFMTENTVIRTRVIRRGRKSSTLRKTGPGSTRMRTGKTSF